MVFESMECFVFDDNPKDMFRRTPCTKAQRSEDKAPFKKSQTKSTINENIPEQPLEKQQVEEAIDIEAPQHENVATVIEGPLESESNTVKSSQTTALPLKYDAFRKTWSKTSEGMVWPCSTTAACWHCCHTFTTVPVPLPTKYSAKLDSFNVVGIFCSWSCAKAYALSTKYSLPSCELLALMRTKVNGKFLFIKPAPNKSKLKMFGGDMTIEEFRAECDYPCTQPISIHISSNPLGVRTRLHYASESNVYGETPVSRSNVMQSNIAFGNISIKKNEPLKLKRNKPFASKGKTVLEKVLGISITSDLQSGQE